MSQKGLTEADSLVVRWMKHGRLLEAHPVRASLTSRTPKSKVFRKFRGRGVRVRDYEIVYVIRPDLSDEDRSAKIDRIRGLITENGGEVGKTEDWGKRVLSYEIRHYAEGFYGLAEFRLPPDAVRTVEDRLNIDEEILRYQIVSLN